jgi:agmatinase
MTSLQDDPSGITSLLAARTSLDFIGSIFHERAKRNNPK